MNVLWIVNIVFPYPASKINQKKSVTLGWLYGLYNTLVKNKDINLAVAATYQGDKLLKFIGDDETIYYLLPCKNQLKYDSNLKKYWKEVVDDFNPSVAHIHGSEYAHAIPFIEACPDVKTVTSIQGLVSVYSKVYYGNIPYFDLLKNISFRDIVKFDNIFQQQKKFYERGINEQRLLKMSDYVIGRTTWDYANSKAIIGNDKYFLCNESLRDDFYSEHWDINKIERHTIFISQSYYPIKGFHFMLEALYILKRKYPDVKCYVSGHKVIGDDSFKSKLKITGYGKYIKKLLKKYELEENVVFLGMLDTKEMISNLKRSNVYVQPSVIENSPNSLGEAMLIGMPCISSNVGGVADLLIHNVEGFTYPYSESAILAHYIEKIFEDDSLAIQLGKMAHKHASITHNRENNCNQTISIYNKINTSKVGVNNERKNKK